MRIIDGAKKTFRTRSFEGEWLPGNIPGWICILIWIGFVNWNYFWPGFSLTEQALKENSYLGLEINWFPFLTLKKNPTLDLYSNLNRFCQLKLFLARFQLALKENCYLGLKINWFPFLTLKKKNPTLCDTGPIFLCPISGPTLGPCVAAISPI